MQSMNAIHAKDGKSYLYPFVFNLSRSSDLSEFWSHFFCLCNSVFAGDPCCLVFFDETGLYLETIGGQKSNQGRGEFFQVNAQFFQAASGSKLAMVKAKDFLSSQKDDFLRETFSESSFFLLIPFANLKMRRGVLIVGRNTEEDIHLEEEKFAIFLAGQLYEKMILAQSLDIAQKTFIHEDKYTTLGHLTAGIAHEMNSPLGAIKAAAVNIQDAKRKMIADLPNVLNRLNAQNQNSFLLLLNLALSRKEFLSSKEERAKKRELIHILTQEGIQEPESVADILVDMGVYQDVGNLIKELGEASSELLQFIYNFASIDRNNENVVIAIERAAKLISAVKGYSKKDVKEEMSLHNVVDGIETVLTLYQHDLKQDVMLVKNLQEVPQVLGNQDELYQVWTNLIYNALQAMDYKGTLEISVTEEKDCVVVSISDSGSGIDENIKNRIFEPYFTTKPRGIGSGLGLDIVKRIVNKHNGTIDFISQPGATTFFVRIPSANSHVEKKEK